MYVNVFKICSLLFFFKKKNLDLKMNIFLLFYGVVRWFYLYVLIEDSIVEY